MQKNILKKVLKRTKNGTLNAAIKHGEEFFLSLKSVQHLVGNKQKIYFAFTEVDGKKIQQLCEKGHVDIAIGYLFLTIKYVGKDGNPIDRASSHVTEIVGSFNR